MPLEFPMPNITSIALHAYWTINTIKTLFSIGGILFSKKKIPGLYFEVRLLQACSLNILPVFSCTVRTFFQFSRSIKIFIMFLRVTNLFGCSFVLKHCGIFTINCWLVDVDETPFSSSMKTNRLGSSSSFRYATSLVLFRNAAFRFMYAEKSSLICLRLEFLSLLFSWIVSILLIHYLFLSITSLLEVFCFPFFVFFHSLRLRFRHFDQKEIFVYIRPNVFLHLNLCLWLDI